MKDFIAVSTLITIKATNGNRNIPKISRFIDVNQLKRVNFLKVYPN